MNQISIYVGLPGSGKTYLATKHHNLLGGIFLDDKFTKTQLLEALQTSQNVFITDPSLCSPSHRTALKTLINGFKEKCIVWFWFENDPSKAFINIKYRNDGRIISEAAVKYHYSKILQIPEDVEVIQIWNDKTPHQEE